MLMAGVPNKYAMERMGHSTDGMLKNVYQHTFQSKQEEYDVVLNDLFNKQDKKTDTAPDGKEEQKQRKGRAEKSPSFFDWFSIIYCRCF